MLPTRRWEASACLSHIRYQGPEDWKPKLMILDDIGLFFFDKWLYTKPSRPVLREWIYPDVPSGKLSHNYGKSPCLMGKSTISMAIFNSKLFVITRGYHFWSLHISAPTFCRMVVQARSLQASTKQLVRCWAKFRAAPVSGVDTWAKGRLARATDHWVDLICAKKNTPVMLVDTTGIAINQLIPWDCGCHDVMAQLSWKLSLTSSELSDIQISTKDISDNAMTYQKCHRW